MKQFGAFFALASLISFTAHAGQSMITESEGSACIGNGVSVSDIEQSALTDAKRNAASKTHTYIQSDLGVSDVALSADLLAAYDEAQVNVLQDLKDEWYKDKNSRDCYRVKLKLEIIPDERVIAKKAKKNGSPTNDPSYPLGISVWMDKDVYMQGEIMKIFVKANKPFYANVVYKQADGSLLQLLPNHVRNSSYFSGGVVYEIPSREDHFDLEVAKPFGFENVTVYASTSPLGALDLRPFGRFFSIAMERSDIPLATRNVIFDMKKNGKAIAEFAEATASAVTRASASQ